MKRRLLHLATAKRRIWSYMEQGDFSAIDNPNTSGAPLLRRIARNAVARHVDHRVVFGFGYRTAPKLVAFLKTRASSGTHFT
ncbi:MAG TPA: hypothetical protein VER03_09055 [Bryobacteraceae bacterium]|nr:hypothetical protein [Bryobacteraceae bacterium]